MKSAFRFSKYIVNYIPFLGQDVGKKYIPKLLRNPSLKSGKYVVFPLKTVASLYVRYPELGEKRPRLPGNHRPEHHCQGPPRSLSSNKGNFQGQCPPVSDGCGNEYET